MSDIAIRVEELGKEYCIGGKQERYHTLRDTLSGALTTPFKRIHSLLRGQAYGAADLSETIWALKDVSFEVKHGEVVGIIGRNGAGKSTLLKILSRITEPTEGCIDLYGRVGALLEVGTGFHPELTGRENIYLNGAILGMSHQEIDHKFDEIVAFAGIEKFIETPVKHYSSGMGLRLGFAVAAHLEPEILVVDEVLAVGDAEFQKKCLGKMNEVAGEGRTVLFVSHNMAAVHMLCGMSIVLDKGSISFYGRTSEAIGRYQSVLRSPDSASSGGPISFNQLHISGNGANAVEVGQPVEVVCNLTTRLEMAGFRLFCLIENSNGEIMIHARTDHLEMERLRFPGDYTIKLNFPPLWLKPGVYSLQLKLIAEMTGKRQGRFVSDNYLLNVSGYVASEMLLGLLTPTAEWILEEE